MSWAQWSSFPFVGTSSPSSYSLHHLINLDCFFPFYFFILLLRCCETLYFSMSLFQLWFMWSPVKDTKTEFKITKHTIYTLQIVKLYKTHCNSLSSLYILLQRILFLCKFRMVLSLSKSKKYSIICSEIIFNISFAQ